MNGGMDSRTAIQKQTIPWRSAFAYGKRSGTKIFLRRMRLEKSSTDVFQNPPEDGLLLYGLWVRGHE